MSPVVLSNDGGHENKDASMTPNNGGHPTAVENLVLSIGSGQGWPRFKAGHVRLSEKANHDSCHVYTRCDGTDLWHPCLPKAGAVGQWLAHTSRLGYEREEEAIDGGISCVIELTFLAVALY